MLHFYLQGFLSLILLRVISGCTGIEALLAFQEEDVALSCFSLNYTDSNGYYRYRWTKYTKNQVKVMFKWPNPSKDVERVKWVADGNGQMCLFLTKSQKSDEGQYTCEMWKGWDLVLAKNISLKIKDCKILEPVKAADNMPAELKCPVNITLGQQESQNISWAMHKGNNRVPVNSNRTKTNGTFLTFQSVATTDRGWYRCSYMFGQTWRCFDINLHVRDKNSFVATTVPVIAAKTQSVPANESSQTNRKEDSSDSFTVVVVLVILGIIIIAASIGFFVYRRYKTQRITPLQQRRFEGNRMSLYEIVTPLADTPSQRVNSLYQMPDESVVTFKY